MFGQSYTPSAGWFAFLFRHSALASSCR